MVESLILLLIYVALVVGAAYLVLYVLGALGVPIPPKVVQVFWIIVGLIVLLMLWRMVGPQLASGNLPR